MSRDPNQRSRPESKRRPSPEGILDIAMGFMAAKVLFAAGSLGLFRALADETVAIDRLAATMGIPERTAAILADAVVALGLAEKDGGRYRSAPDPREYLSGRGERDLRPLLALWDQVTYVRWTGLEEALRLGTTRREPAGLDQFAALYSDAVASATAGIAEALSARLDFARHERLLDVGGGLGSFLIAIMRRHPGIRGTLLERPEVARRAARNLTAAGVRERVTIVEGDFLTGDIPPQHDVILLANVVHLLSPASNLQLLGRARQSVRPGARLLLVDFWLDESRAHPLQAALLSASFFLLTGEGQSYGRLEASAWLDEAGWRVIAHHPLEASASLLLAEAC